MTAPTPTLHWQVRQLAAPLPDQTGRVDLFEFCEAGRFEIRSPRGRRVATATTITGAHTFATMMAGVDALLARAAFADAIDRSNRRNGAGIPQAVAQ